MFNFKTIHIHHISYEKLYLFKERDEVLMIFCFLKNCSKNNTYKIFVYDLLSNEERYFAFRKSEDCILIQDYQSIEEL